MNGDCSSTGLTHHYRRGEEGPTFGCRIKAGKIPSIANLPFFITRARWHFSSVAGTYGSGLAARTPGSGEPGARLLRLQRQETCRGRVHGSGVDRRRKCLGAPQKMARAGSSGGQGTAAPTRRFSLFVGGDDGAMDDSSEKSLGMPGRGGHGEPPVQGFSLFRAVPASPLWTTNIRLRWSGEGWRLRELQTFGSAGAGRDGGCASYKHSAPLEAAGESKTHPTASGRAARNVPTRASSRRTIAGVSYLVCPAGCS
jgi:hypothetical protein